MKIRDDRQMRALTGVTKAQFKILLDIFNNVYTQMQWQAYEEGLAAGTRTRAPGGGKKGALPTGKEKLLFVLYYFKVYPTFDVLGTQFNMSRSRAHEHVYKLAPVLDQTLVELGVMPHRKFTTTDEFREAIEDIETLLIDVTERNHRRPQDNKVQREHYSGKKNDTQSKTRL